MKLPVLKGLLLYYTIALSLLASMHLIHRSWYPIDRSVRPFESKKVNLAIEQLQIPDAMSTFLASFSIPQTDQTTALTEQKPKGDRKELGDFFITLLAIYKGTDGHKAILEVTEKASGNTQLKHVSMGDSFEEISITSISGTICSIRFRDSQLNFRLFTPERATDASVE